MPRRGLCALALGALMVSGCALRASDGVPAAPRGVAVRCATAGVVGLRWTPPSAGADVAAYRIDRDGVALGSTPLTEFSDPSVSGARTYMYAVAALGATGRWSAAATVAVTTAAASRQGDAPYCPSSVIPSLKWNWSAGYTQANGSDLWPVTWARDGNVYTSFGDGGGFGGSDSLGRASFGIAMLTAPPPLTAAHQVNVYGGLRPLHPAALAGKAGSIIAVHANFYAIAEIYRPADSPEDYRHLPSGSPNHIELAYSIGNAYSWQDSPWTFCSADASGNEHLTGTFCPVSFVQYGKGNAGAPGDYVYILGVANSRLEWSGGVGPLPNLTYLARVAGNRMLTPAAYQFFAGLDASANPVWSADVARMHAIFSDGNPAQSGCGGTCNMASTLSDVVYDAALKRYIGVAQGDFLSQSSFYEAPTLWGPWSTIAYYNMDASGTGGWADLGRSAGDALGLHPVSAWTSRDGKTLWLTFSSNGKAADGALFPPAGTSMDSFNVVSVTLNTAATRCHAISCL